MIRVLVVDDEYEKAHDLRVRTNPAVVAIDHVSTAHAARMALRDSAVDLLVLDLNLPGAVGDSPSARGGIDLFDLIKIDSAVNLPADVIFVTAKEDLIKSETDEIEKRGAHLYRHSPSHSARWLNAVVGRIDYIAALKAHSDPCVDVAIVTALRSPELSAVLELDYGWEARKLKGKSTHFHFGTIHRSGRPALTVVAACAQRKGMASSSALASHMSAIFRPRLLAMLGICAGRKERTNIGDVIVADPAWDWGSGKHAQGADGSAIFEMSPHQTPLDPSIAQLVMEMEHDESVGLKIRASWRDECPETSIAVRKGPMASGASVLALSGALEGIADSQNRDLLGVDMESYAVMAAAEYSAAPRPLAIAAKSVCDFGDEEKHKKWQRFCAYTSAQFFHHLLSSPRFPI